MAKAGRGWSAVQQRRTRGGQRNCIPTPTRPSARSHVHAHTRKGTAPHTGYFMVISADQVLQSKVTVALVHSRVKMVPLVLAWQRPSGVP